VLTQFVWKKERKLWGKTLCGMQSGDKKKCFTITTTVWRRGVGGGRWAWQGIYMTAKTQQWK